jgi:uncharacterized protein YdaU (DUF1376 family)
MSKMPGMMLWVPEYLADTQGLTTLQNGAYLLILMSMWMHGGSVPNNEKQLAQISGLTLGKWRRISYEVLAKFMVVKGEDGLDHLTQKRLMLEFEKTSGLNGKRRAAGEAGNRAKALKRLEPDLANASAHASGLRTQNGDFAPEIKIKIKTKTEET